MQGNNNNDHGASAGGGGGGGGGMVPLPTSGMLGLGMTSLHHPHQQHLLVRHGYPAKAGERFDPRFGGGDGDDDDEVAARRLSQQYSGGGGGPSTSSSSPWHRMKWTDSMVRLLIMIVYCVGDDATDHPHQPPPAPATAPKGIIKLKQQPPAAGAGGLQLLQKKGKWKSVSRAMMEKGFYVSPQQCEDKFNDLNKRYKRVNELLGKGTACRVVENRALLDTLDHVSPKSKEEARKLLSSKHLFFREMCAYHNTCTTPPLSSSSAPASASAVSPQLQLQPHRHCFSHPSSDDGNILPTQVRKDQEEEHDDHHDNNRCINVIEDDDNDAQESDDDEEEEDDYDDDDDDEDEDNAAAAAEKRIKKQGQQLTRGATNNYSLSATSPPLSLSLSTTSSPAMLDQQLRSDLMGSLAGIQGEEQQRQWLKRKAAELEEQRVGYQFRALKLERQRFKWLRFSTNKEREMEKMKLSNERLLLENHRMLLLLRHKEEELLTHQF